MPAPDWTRSHAVFGSSTSLRETRILRFAPHFGVAFLIFPTILWVGSSVCFVGGWDHVAAVTTFPQWSWAILGMLSATLAWRLLNNVTRLPLLLLTLWVLVTLYFSHNLGPILRGFLYGAPSPSAQSGNFRVVTLNCASIEWWWRIFRFEAGCWAPFVRSARQPYSVPPQARGRRHVFEFSTTVAK